MTDWDSALEQIAAGLWGLANEGGDGNFLIVAAGDVYVQFAGEKGKPEIDAEAVGAEYLAKPGLQSAQVDTLRKLGYELAEGDANYSRKFAMRTRDDAQAVARTGLDILQRVYGVRRGATLELQLTLE
jgi:hypothetical protein